MLRFRFTSFLTSSLLYFALLLPLGVAFCQNPVSSDEFFPGVDGTYKIFFDATAGNEGLRDFEGDIFLHTGVITSQSSGPSDWRYVQGEWGVVIERLKMTREGDNLYSFEFTPRTFYNIPEDEQVLQFSFVFRNGDGTRSGRASGGGDVYLDIFDESLGPHIRLLEPEETSLILEDTTTRISLSVVASDNADFFYYLDSPDATNACLSLVPNTPLVSTLDITDNERHDVFLFSSCDEPEEFAAFSYVRIASEDKERDLIGHRELGMTKLGADSARFVIEAPGKTSIYVLGTFNDWKIDNECLMYRSLDGSYFWLDVKINEPDIWHAYQYLVDESITIADPLSTLVLDPIHDGEITYELPQIEVPNSIPASLVHLNQDDYPWSVTDFEAPSPESLVIYEILLRDFLEDHSFSSLIDTLDYLVRLGINAIELMPVNEFEANDSWGYNPSYHNALDKYYGTPEDFKRLVDEAHRRGMAVIVDIVFNHGFGQCPLARMYWDNVNSRPSEDNPWFNPVPKHPFNVGNDFNHESEYTQRYFNQILKFWLNEYNLDGYRFDLSKGLTQTESLVEGDALFRLYDESRIETIKNFADVVWSENSLAYVILEHFAEDREQRELADYGCLFWNNQTHVYNEATMGYTDNTNSDLSGTYYAGRGYSVPALVSYMESHDEERLMYKNQEFGNMTEGYSTRDLETAIDRVKLATAFFYAIPGPKMLWQFGELGYDYSINRCTNGSISGDCRLSRKPYGFMLQSDPLSKELYNWTSDMIWLYKNFDISNANSYEGDLAKTTKSIIIDDEAVDIVVVGNFDIQSQSHTVELPSSGMWYDYFSGDSLQLSAGDQSFDLAAGEFFVLTTLKIDRPSENDFTVSVQGLSEDNVGEARFGVYSALDFQSVYVVSKEHTTLSNPWRSEIYDNAGRRVMMGSIDPKNQKTELSLQELSTGIYFLKLSHGGYSEVHKIYRH